MVTRTWVIAERSPNGKERAGIAEIIRHGEVVILPTDTIYGFHAEATNADAVAKIFRIKGRDEHKPLVVLASDPDEVVALGAIITEPAANTLRSIWPAPLTAILALNRPLAASADAVTIAVRIPDCGWLLDLLRVSGPLASTSMNRSGEPPIYTIAALPAKTKNQVGAVLDIGPLEAKASTIVDFTVEPPEIVRQGDFRFSQNLWKTPRKSL
ncbi:MAG: L-threonylcarbamoyladenylate synthase [Acidobacteriota bacterium]